jgi:hypothetical protein
LVDVPVTPPLPPLPPPLAAVTSPTNDWATAPAPPVDDCGFTAVLLPPMPPKARWVVPAIVIALSPPVPPVDGPVPPPVAPVPPAPIEMVNDAPTVSEKPDSSVNAPPPPPAPPARLEELT